MCDVLREGESLYVRLTNINGRMCMVMAPVRSGVESHSSFLLKAIVEVVWSVLVLAGLCGGRGSGCSHAAGPLLFTFARLVASFLIVIACVYVQLLDDRGARGTGVQRCSWLLGIGAVWIVKAMLDSLRRVDPAPRTVCSVPSSERY